MGFAEYGRHDALGLAALVRAGDVQAEELLDEALARTATANPAINAVIHVMEERARAAIAAGLPDGPFRGVPFLIKDLMTALAGEPMRSGSRLFRDFVPAADEELTRRYKAAGLVIFGKTNTPEFGVSNVTEPELFGPTRNPWNLERTSSGSSGGSAAMQVPRMTRTRARTSSTCTRSPRRPRSQGCRTVNGDLRRARPVRGFTLIELLVVVAIIATLLTIAAPRYFVSLERSKETVLRQDLSVMREAIDRYAGDLDQYPDSLTALVERGYIRAIPQDPFTRSVETWVVVPSEDPERPGIRDVRSGAEGSGVSRQPFADF
ncbi:MAG TPA: amidase family protein [Steroidobacteraceae bacterium]|nr:amidase family protein [Steroidobacteraceae bacterium]